MFRSKRLPTGISEKITKRVRALPSSDLVDWADQAIYSTGRNLTTYLRERNRDSLSEAHIGAEVILAIVEEIQRRDAQ